MALARPDETNILSALYTDAADRPKDEAAQPWQLFLNRLCRLTRAQAAVFLFESRALPIFWHHGAQTETILAQLALAPNLVTLRQMRFDRVYADHPATAILQPHFTAARSLRVPTPDGSAWLILLRSGEDFRAVDGVALSSLAPHLPLALGIWNRLAKERAQASLTTNMAARLGLAWLAFDTHGQVIGQSPAAQDVLAATPHIRLDPQHRLRLGDALAERAVLAAVDAASTSTTVVALSRAPLVQLVVTAPPTEETAPIWRDVAAVGMLRGPRPQAAPTAALVANTFGLNLGEARLALQLCHGASLAEAATALGLTIETARNYSKKIYAATGLHGQPDLIRLLLNSAIWLAP